MILTIDDFEGPLDLLLHLVKANKMDIYDIDIAFITQKYLDFLDKSKDLSIDATSEYLVMASELVHLKSKVLLNQNEETDEDYEFDNPEDLQRRLLEYEKIKNITEDFKELEDKRSQIYTRIPYSLEEYKVKEELNNDIGLDDLLNAFSLFLKRQKQAEPTSTRITKKELSVEERCITIRSRLKSKAGRFNFLELFDNISKPYVVVTFLSILDMAKNGEIKITQDNNFKDIFIESA